MVEVRARVCQFCGHKYIMPCDAQRMKSCHNKSLPPQAAPVKKKTERYLVKPRRERFVPTVKATTRGSK